MTRQLLEQTRATASSWSCWGRVQIDGPGCQVCDAPSRRCGTPERPRCKARSRLNNFGLWNRMGAFAQRERMRDLRRRRWNFWERARAREVSPLGPNADTGPCFRRSRTHDDGERHDSWTLRWEGREAENQVRCRSGAAFWAKRQATGWHGRRIRTRSYSWLRQDNVVRGVGCDARRGCGEEMGVPDGINDA